jgi:integrase
MLLSQVISQFVAFMQGHNRPGTIGYYTRHLDRFLAQVGNVEVSELRKHHLLTWGKTWHAMQAVQRLFTWAHADAELIDRNPFKGMKRPRLGGRRRVLSRLEQVKMLRGSSPEFRAYLLALRETIARPQEIKCVRWEDLRFEGENLGLVDALVSGKAFFEIWEYKSRELRSDPDTPRVILVNARLGRLLARLAAGVGQPAGLVFNNGQGRQWTSNAIRLRVRRLCRRLRLVADARGEPIVAYTFRHTAATSACARGIPDRILAEIMGHTTTRTTARYQHPSRGHLRDAMKRLSTPTVRTRS